MSALYPLQVAIVQRLESDAGVGALIGDRIFELTAPDGTTLPFVTVDTPTGVEEGGTFGATGFGHTIMVHVFASEAAKNEGVTSAAAVVKTALRAPLTLTGHVSVRLKLEFETVLAEPNVRHQPMRFALTAWET